MGRMAVRRGPVSYHEYKQRVRRYRRSDVLRAVARFNSGLDVVAETEPDTIDLQSPVKGFSLAGLARTSLASGNESRHAKDIDIHEIRDLCWYYANVDEPEDGTEPGTEHLRQMLARIGYEQIWSQLSPMEEIGRSIVLFEDYASASGLPGEDEWRSAFGGSVGDLVNVGFAAHVGAARHGGMVPYGPMADPALAPAYGSLTSAEAVAVLDNFYSATVAGAAEWAKREERAPYEKWSPSPLLDTPIIILENGDRVVPWNRALMSKFSPNGIFYAGIRTFGTAFPEALGTAFEAYVGDNLRLLTHATSVIPERVYGKPERKTCDWIVVFDECVLLVEVKATRPNADLRLGTPEGYADLARKVGKAAGQIETTSQLIADRHPVMHDVPADRPLVGLVVTLEPFLFVDPWLYRDVLGGRSVPTEVIYSHMLEGVIPTIGDERDAGRRILDTITRSGAVGRAGAMNGTFDDAAAGLTGVRNPILVKAWDRVGPRTDGLEVVDHPDA